MFNSNGDNGMYMPVAPAYGYGGGFGNSGFFGGDGIWALLIIALLFGGGLGGWGGFGGFGGWGGMMGMDAMMLAPYFFNTQTQNDVNRGFDNSALSNQIASVQSSVDEVRTGSQLSAIQSAVTGGFSDVQLGIAGVNQNICQSTGQIQNALCNGFAGTTAAVTNAQNAVTQQLFNNEINSLNRSFAEQTANAQGFNAAARQLADCCCENRLAVQGLNSTIISENCADREALTNTEYRLTTLVNNGIQSIKDQLCQDKIDAKNEKIVELQNQLAMKDLAASQTAQTAQLLADNARQTQDVENYVRPQINPSYIVPNPYAYNFYPGNGWNNGNGCGCNGNAFFN